MESNPLPEEEAKVPKKSAEPDIDSGSSFSSDEQESEPEEVHSDDSHHFLHFKNSDHFMNKTKIKVTSQPNEKKTRFRFLEGRCKGERGKIWHQNIKYKDRHKNIHDVKPPKKELAPDFPPFDITEVLN